MSHQVWPNWLKYAVMGIILFFLWIFNNAFLTPLLLGFIMATLTYPVHTFVFKQFQKIKTKRLSFHSLSAIVTILLISVTLGFVLNLLIRGVSSEIPSIAKEVVSFVSALPENQKFVDTLSQVGISKEQIQVTIDSAKATLGNVTGDPTKHDAKPLFTEENIVQALSFGKQTITIVFDYIVATVIFFLAWFNGLVYGKQWVQSGFELLPLSRQEALSIKDNLRKGIRNVIYANFLSGFIHAAICFLFLLVFGIPNIWTLTLLIFLIGVLPISPSELAYAIVIAAIFPKNSFIAILLIPIAELIVCYVNFVLLPKIIAAGKEGNTLLILTSILSGIVIFGVMGFIIAPVIMIFVQTLYSILTARLKQEPIYETLHHDHRTE